VREPQGRGGRVPDMTRDCGVMAINQEATVVLDGAMVYATEALVRRDGP
jgi:hypothetical protein